MRSFIIISILLLGLMTTAQEVRKATAVRIVGEAPTIDGHFDEAVWQLADWEGGFTQREPYDGKEPTQKTEFKAVYDNEAIYFAIMAYDTEPDKIEKRLSRRDNIEGDMLAVSIDSYFDRRTSFAFLVNAAGVKGDIMEVNDTEDDETWDPVWYVKVNQDAGGWMAEMKVPYTQLRFTKQDTLVWGFQVMRWIFRNDEFSCWQPIPRDAAGWVSRYGELHGISGIKPKKEVELIPYLMGNIQTYEKEEGNPFADGTDVGYNAGLDAKIAVTNDLTLNLTVNPDFGQVEADPSVVNLTAFETFYEEKRPFFVEGNNIFSFKPTGGNGHLSQDNLFYSRRIGRSPHHCPELTDQECMKMPEATTILGAVKLSGKTRSGWSVGIMDALTQREQATIDNEGQQRKETVEPLTNYFNTRLQKDMNEGNTLIGGMVTATHRSLEDSCMKYLYDQAYTGGLDYTQFWKERTYQLKFSGIFSYVSGSRKAIQELQESPVHLYQRPDRDHARLDTTRTSLAGHGGSISFAKFGAGHWRYWTWVTWRSPGLELNDMGYLRQADIIQQVIWGGYRVWEPKGIYRQFNINFNEWSGWDFGGNYVYSGGNMNGWIQFKNFWEFSCGMELDAWSVDRFNLRGGPALKVPGGGAMWVFFESDTRKKLSFEPGFVYSWASHDNMMGARAELNLNYRPIKSLQVVFGPSYEFGHDRLQYVTTVDDTQEARYIMGRIDNHVLMANLRINLSITPDLSIQYWGQPFLFAGDYSEFKKATETMSDDYYERYHAFSDDEISFNEEENMYLVSELGGSQESYSFDNPDFKVFEWRSNLVARWEYIPGSALYVVWSQGRMGDDNVGTPDLGHDMEDLFSIKPHNVFLIKLTYRISI